MDAVVLFRHQLAESHRLLEGIVRDLTDDRFHATIAGRGAGSIASIYLHILCVEDNFIHTVCQGMPATFDSEGWATRLNLYDLGFRTANWDSPPFELPPHFRLVKHLLREYGREVYDESEAFLAKATPGDFDEIIVAGPGRMSKGQALASFVLLHQMGHVGEMSLLKSAGGVTTRPYCGAGQSQSDIEDAWRRRQQEPAGTPAEPARDGRPNA